MFEKQLIGGFFGALAGTVLAVVLVAVTGCETETASATDPVFIVPDTATVLAGASVSFTAQGGYDYRWSIQNDEWGYLTTGEGPTTTYVSMHDPGFGTTDVQILTLESTIDLAEVGATGYVQRTTARILHASAQRASIKVTSSDTDNTLSQYGSMTLTVTGGSGDYVWALREEAWGNLSSRSGGSVIYTSTLDPGSNTVAQVISVNSPIPANPAAGLDAYNAWAEITVFQVE